MKIRKLRGHRRIWKEIEAWRKANLELDLEYLKYGQRAYVKISPLKYFSILNSEFPEPKGKTRELALQGLLDIYDSWQLQLERLGQPYYLKLWLYEHRFSSSQVVCAIGDALDFYEISFHQPDIKKQPDLDHFGKLKPRMKEFQWQYVWEEVHLSSRDIGTPGDFYSEEEYLKNKKEITSRLEKPHRKTIEKDDTGEVTEYYSFKLGTVWLGEK